MWSGPQLVLGVVIGDNRSAMAESSNLAPVVSDEHGTRPRPTVAQLKVAAGTFDLLSIPIRLHLVWLAAQGEHDVGSLAEQAGVPIATASQHLAKLRLGGIVSGRRDGRHQIYTVDDPHVVALIEQIFDHIRPDGQLAPDPPPTRR
jgi:DNA-binding transcriptional ArsR family regulator